MREHKYRGKRLSNGEWVYGNLIYNYDPHQKENVIIEWYIRKPLRNIGSVWQVDPDTVGQYTGLKDKDGKDIFEGDIVRIGSIDSRLPEVASIFWWNGQFVFEASVNMEHDYINFGWWVRSNNNTNTLRQIEVIGNIHDNPDLIK